MGFKSKIRMFLADKFLGYRIGYKASGLTKNVFYINGLRAKLGYYPRNQFKNELNKQAFSMLCRWRKTF